MAEEAKDNQSIIESILSDRLGKNMGHIERIGYLGRILEQGKLSPETHKVVQGIRDLLVQQGTLQSNKQEGDSSGRQLPQQLVFYTCLRLGRIFGGSLASGASGGVRESITDMAASLQKAVEQDRNAALAGAYLDIQNTYFVLHHIQAALLTEILGISAGLSREDRLPLICGALMLDVGLIDVHHQLETQGKISDELRAAIQAHPEKGHAKCKELGVTNELWLDVMLSHHERLDGSGYPRKLAGDAISVGTRVVAIADCYSAMIRHRPYRKAFTGKDALRELYLLKDQLDMKLIQLLVRNLGIYPPGSIVRLAEGEVGVVVRSTENAMSPVVYSFMNQKGVPLPEPQRRNTELEKYSVRNIEPLSNYKSNITGLLKLWA